MNTILYSVVGIIVLIAISFLFSSIEILRSNKAAKQLAALRKKLALKAAWLVGEKNEVSPSAFRRNTSNSKLNIFPANGNTPVL